MPVSPDFHYPRRYNSLRLLGFNYQSTTALWFISLNTVNSRPVFGDIQLAKQILAALLNGRTLSRLRIYAYTLMPDHFHLLAGIRREEKSLSSSLGAFKGYTTQLFWKRANEIIKTQSVSLPSANLWKSNSAEAKPLLAALIDWRATLRPEMVEIRNWPNVSPQHFLSKTLWHNSFYEHIIRNDNDFRETVEYIAFNPVKRGYVSKPQFYPFTGFLED